MADSDVAVCNIALTFIGDNAITSMSEDNDRAKALSRIYTPTLDTKIRSHNWNAFQMRAALNELADAPVWGSSARHGFDHMFQLPQDPLCLHVIATNLADDEAWRIETFETSTASYRVLLTNTTTVSILYLARITDVTLWDASFTDAFAHELALRLAYGITAKETLVQSLERRTAEAWRVARARDGQEGLMKRKLEQRDLTDVR